jgi:hypothetical protein
MSYELLVKAVSSVPLSGMNPPESGCCSHAANLCWSWADPCVFFGSDRRTRKSISGIAHEAYEQQTLRSVSDDIRSWQWDRVSVGVQPCSASADNHCFDSSFVVSGQGI